MPWQPKKHNRGLKTRRWKNLCAQVLAEESFCGICYEDVDKSKNGRTDPEGPHVGHILPVVSHPHLEFDRTNVELQHRRCNLRAGA